MTIWIREDIRLTAPLAFEDQAKNVVVLGKLTSDFDVSFKVKNLIVFGGIVSTKNVTLNTTADFFNSGSINGYNVRIVSDANIYNGLDDRAIEKIRALGIDLGLTPRIPDVIEQKTEDK